MLAETRGLCKANVIATIFVFSAPKWSLIPMRGQKAKAKQSLMSFLKEGPNGGLCVRAIEQVELSWKENTRAGRGSLHCPGRMQEKAIPESDTQVRRLSLESLKAPFILGKAALA